MLFFVLLGVFASHSFVHTMPISQIFFHPLVFFQDIVTLMQVIGVLICHPNVFILLVMSGFMKIFFLLISLNRLEFYYTLLLPLYPSLYSIPRHPLHPLHLLWLPYHYLHVIIMITLQVQAQIRHTRMRRPSPLIALLFFPYWFPCCHCCPCSFFSWLFLMACTYIKPFTTRFLL